MPESSRWGTLAFCYFLSGDERYGEGACKWLLHFASWNPAGTTSMDVNDEAGMPILHITSRAYDWRMKRSAKRTAEPCARRCGLGARRPTIGCTTSRSNRRPTTAMAAECGIFSAKPQ